MKMVSGFRRSLSFSHPRLSPETPRRHLRSTSLPSRLHPSAAHLADQIHALESWQTQTPAGSPPARLADGLDRLDWLHAALLDLLPRSKPHRRLLDESLRLADAHGSFRSLLIDLRRHHSAARAAARRSDPVRLSFAARAQRRAEKDIARLAAAVRRTAPADAADLGEDEVVGAAMTATVAALAAIFAGAAGGATSASRWGRILGRSKCEKVVMMDEDEERELEEGMALLEEKSERVFRRLVDTRVALLNILTPGFY